MKIASYNLENLFRRAAVLNQDLWTKKGEADDSRWAAAKHLLEAYAELNALLSRPVYSAADKQAMVDLLGILGLKRANESKYFILRENKGRLLKRPKGKPPQVAAGGRGDWVGWLDMAVSEVEEAAVLNTGRIVKELDADVLAVIEAEDRVALNRFNEQVLGGKQVAGTPYEHVMLIDGNDDRGIDVGMFTRKAYPIAAIQSHVDDKDANGKRIFSRDCAHYEIRTPKNERVLVLVNHFKSKGYGLAGQSDARRRAQAQRVRAIYDEMKGATPYIAVVGDFNDVPDSKPLQPLLAAGDMKDISRHPKFRADAKRPGTYGNGTASEKIDFILLSPALYQRVTDGGVERRGVWGGKKGTLFPHLATITKPSEAASDHAAIWAVLDV